MKHPCLCFCFLFALGLPLTAAAQFGLNLFGPERLPDAQRFSVVLEMGDVRQAKTWLDMGLDPNFEGHTIGTGLMIGAWEGNIEMMELFLRRGADINRVNRFGETALMHTAWKNRQAAMRWLIERGAQVNRPDREWTALHYATFAGHAPLVNDLLAAGADVNARSTNGSSVLMMAAREGHDALARRLLAAGANPALRNDFEEDAAAWAMKNRHFDVAKSITTPEAFAALARAPQPRPAQRSQPAPDTVEEHLRMARLAHSQGNRKEAVEAYRKAFAELKAQESARKDGATRQAAARAPTGVVIRARRDKPEEQAMALSYEAAAQKNAALPSPGTNEDTLDELLERARAAEAAGRRREALRIYRQLSQGIRHQQE